MDYKKLTKGGRAAQISCFCQRHLISKPLMLAPSSGQKDSFGRYAPTSKLPRRDSGHSGPRQPPVSLVGNSSHRLQQLYLLDVGALWRSQPQSRHKQRLKLLQHDHNIQPNHPRPRATLHRSSDCGKLHTTPQSPRWRSSDIHRRTGSLCGTHRLHCFQQLSRKRLHKFIDRLRNNIWSSPHVGFPTRILSLHRGNHLNPHRTSIPYNHDQTSR